MSRKSFCAIILFVSWLLLSCNKSGFVAISNRAEKVCAPNSNKFKGKSFAEIRKELYRRGALDFVKTGFDTLNFLETYVMEEGAYYGRIWNRKGIVNYVYDRDGQFEFKDTPAFSAYTIQLVQNWDTTAIRREEQENAHEIHQKSIKAVRIIMPGLYIQCITLKEFYKFERDNTLSTQSPSFPNTISGITPIFSYRR